MLCEGASVTHGLLHLGAHPPFVSHLEQRWHPLDERLRVATKDAQVGWRGCVARTRCSCVAHAGACASTRGGLHARGNGRRTQHARVSRGALVRLGRGCRDTRRELVGYWSADADARLRRKPLRLLLGRPLLLRLLLHRLLLLQALLGEQVLVLLLLALLLRGGLLLGLLLKLCHDLPVRPPE